MSNRVLAATFRAVICFSFSLALPAAADDDRADIPSAAAQAKSLELVREVYGAEWQSAESLEAKRALAVQLINAAGNSPDSAEGFALLRAAVDISVAACDPEIMATAIDRMAANFRLEAFRTKLALIAKLESAAETSALKKSLVAFLRALKADALDREHYDVASRIGSKCAELARSSLDIELAKDVVAENREHDEIIAAYAKIKDALTRLKSVPDNPEDNLAVGRFYGFIRGDWDRAIPMLALGSDPKLKELAIQELNGFGRPEQQTAVADGWWDLAESSSPLAEPNLRRRALDHYRAALPKLQGLLKNKVAARIESAADALPDDRAGGKTEPTLVDLLALVDPESDTVAGRWAKKGGDLASDRTKEARIRFPYHPPPEYDLMIEFTRLGTDIVGAVLSHDGTPFIWGTGHAFKNAGFASIDGKGMSSNVTTVLRPELAGNRYAWKIEVRNDRIAAYIDGQLVAQHKTDYRDIYGMWDGFKTGDNRAIGLESHSPTVFHSVRVQEIGQSGEVITDSTCIRDRLAILTTGGLKIPKSRTIAYPIRVPKLSTENGLLEVAVHHMEDDAGDRGMYANLLDERRKLVHRWFGKSDDWETFRANVTSESNWWLVLEDKDTRFSGSNPSNGLSVRVYLTPQK